ncbi:hypothetical protein [Paenibacillus chitinolyticus]|uniref:hypothetical protein n=1 Tax=Paenibacillus chitinolyticus TaxID=79263 RepID=UPI003D020077
MPCDGAHPYLQRVSARAADARKPGSLFMPRDPGFFQLSRRTAPSGSIAEGVQRHDPDRLKAALEEST